MPLKAFMHAHMDCNTITAFHQYSYNTVYGQKLGAPDLCFLKIIIIPDLFPTL